MRPSSTIVRSGPVKAKPTGGLLLNHIVPSDIDQSFTYGVPTKSRPPMKDLIGNLFGEISTFHAKMKTKAINRQYEEYRYAVYHPPREPTRATLLANSFLNELRTPQAQSNFKLSKF